MSSIKSHLLVENTHILWMGDLNYRVKGTYYMAEKLVEHQKWEVLKNNDQLLIERNAVILFRYD